MHGVTGGHDDQQRWFGGFDSSRPVFRNPLYRWYAPARLVEQLVQAARGGAADEHGSGKFAVVGRIAPRSDPAERMELSAHGSLTPEDPDPREGVVDAVVQARGQNLEGLLTELTRQLGLSTVVSVYGIFGQLARSGRRPVVLLEALDEAQQTDLGRIVDTVRDLPDKPDTAVDIAAYVAARLAGTGNVEVSQIARR